MFAGAVNVAPPLGEVSDTVGGALLAGFTVTLTAVDVVVAPALSRATAVSEYVPAAALLQVAVYGLLESLAISVDPR